MKKKLLFLFSVFFCAHFSFAQNLVPNPSFEDTVACPRYATDIDKAVGWGSYGLTPDYYNQCANISSPIFGVPHNWAGNQYAYDGDAYVGLVTWSGPSSAYREFVGCQLLSPLTTGTKYYVSAHISKADSDYCRCSTNNFGFKFSNQSYSGGIPAPVNNISHIHSDSIISNINIWTEISGSFVADSAYQYFMFGNFYDNNYTDTLDCPSVNVVAYYFVDAICVCTDSLFCANWSNTNGEINGSISLKIYPNPVASILTIEYSGKNKNYTLTNITQKLVLTGKLKSGINKIDISSLPPGFYILNFDRKHYYKIIIN